MFAIGSDNFGYGPRIYYTSYPRTRNFYRPTQYFYPCSYYHNNVSPFYYSNPQNYSYFEDDNDDEEDQREQLFRELLNRKMAQRQQQQEEEEREREQQEQLKRFYERKAREREQAQRPGSSPKKSFRVKIQGGEDEEKSKSQAARKIFNFIKNQTANKQTRKILDKFYLLRKIENELKEIHNSKDFGNLTFVEEHEKKLLPISVDNKRFLEYEDKILKLFDKLDRVQSDGVDIIRERRKLIVKSAQALLEELDNEKENQWKAFNEKRSNSDVIMNDAENSELNSDMVINEVENSDERLTKETDDISLSSNVVPENEGNEVIVGEEQLDIEVSTPTTSPQSNIEVSNQNNQSSFESIQESI